MADGASSVLHLAAQIVSAHVSNNAVATDQLPKLINDVHRALANAGETPAPSPSADPAVPVKKSVFADHLLCLGCGKRFSMLKRHLRVDHQMTPEQYRQRWGLTSSYPLVAPDYTKVRSALAKKIGLGRKPGEAAPKRRGRRPSRKQ